MDQRLKIAYILGCKIARLDNANQLAKQLDSLDKGKDASPTQSIGQVSDLMRNFDEKRESESTAPYGEKHQLAINPEWSGP
jgi:hypothetical protein